MLLAGFETSSTTIIWALYELARHPDIQRTLRAELQLAQAGLSIDASGRLPVEQLSSLPYLDAVTVSLVSMIVMLPADETT